MSKLIHPVSFRLFFLPWIVTWVLIIPLFHIHTLDVQEDRAFSQMFLAHTVFSPDLPGEYTPQSTGRQAKAQDNQHSFSTHSSNYSEEAISVFSEDDSKQRKRVGSVSHGPIFPLKDVVPNSGRFIIPDLPSPGFMLLASSVFLRAPPSVFS